MDALIIKKTETTPAIVFNPSNGVFQISKTSWPENAQEFYSPIIDWLNKYFQNKPLSETIFEFRITYMNTASSKQIAKILSILKKFSSTHKIKIKWLYEKGDFDMKNDAIRYSKILKINFDIIEK